MIRKSEITYHQLGYSNRSVPAVNVKIAGSGADVNRDAWRDFAKFQGRESDPRFTPEWVERELTEAARGFWFDQACQQGWEQLQHDLDAHPEYFWPGAKVYSEGRSAGWAYIDGITADQVEGWDAIALAKWAKFAKWARATADDVPYQWLGLIYANVFEPWAEAEREKMIAAAVAEGLSL